MKKKLLECNENNEHKIEKEKNVVFDLAAILQWAVNSKPIKFSPKKKREDIVFLKEDDMPTIRNIQKVLSATTESITTKDDVRPKH